MPANRTLLCSYLSFTLSELDLFMELLIGWNPYAGWKDLLSEAGISSDCKTWLFDRAYALEFIQVKAGLSLWKPREPSWMMQKNLRKSATKQRAATSVTPELYTALLLLTPGSCVNIERSCFSTTDESLWKMRGREQKVSGFCKWTQDS